MVRDRVFTKVYTDRTRGDECKLNQDRFRLDLREKFFIIRMVRHWNLLLKEIVNAPSVEVFKATLSEALSNLV